jgi:hypothetical protein
MSSSVSGRGGLVTMYLKHCSDVSCNTVYEPVNTYVQTLVEFLLLLVNYAKTEVDLVGLLKVRLHAHDL